ncbi:cytochrome ubiquinol oxidase subunit I [Nocardiopsis halophila]|uniref:cytochrome ubiquinol oxidase subunit I n=1 Tax=Nocardiopsis halophila TaxID=141692 RepID=UPI000349969F|nr:cytochrome ubiquinol oxidase subunit I [Nocardiopsis halophila]
MDAIDLSRLQFALTTGIHWLFVLLTLGLAPLVAVLHTASAAASDPERRARRELQARFWGQLYVVNYALGIVSGLVMEFQLGLNWSGLGEYAGNIVGAPVALEGMVAFFAESTFLGLWIFGWGRLGPRLHAALIWLVALTAYASAYFILVANGFMQHPVGHEVRGGTAYLADLGAVMANPNALVALGHVTAAALVTGGLAMAGVAAYHFARRTPHTAFFRAPLRLGVGVAALACYPLYAVGDVQFRGIAEQQPLKTAVLEGGAEGAAHAPPAWIAVPAETMVALGWVLFFAPLIALVLLPRDLLVRTRPLAWAVVALVPLPFIASVCGWLFREAGRQPWLVYGELAVTDAASPVPAAAVAASLVLFTGVLGALAAADWVIIARLAHRGPDGVRLGAPEPEPDPDPAPHTVRTP